MFVCCSVCALCVMLFNVISFFFWGGSFALLKFRVVSLWCCLLLSVFVLFWFVFEGLICFVCFV